MATANKLKAVLITFDYELFLGNISGSVEGCLITPTERILKILDRHACKAVFFVDTTYLLRLKEIAENYSIALNDYSSIVQQLQKMARNGHYIFPHIHPHWTDAEYDPQLNQWKLRDFSKYCFSSIDAGLRDELFGRSVAILNEIIKPFMPAYCINGYRAGGWSIQPFSDFKPCFEKYGIVNEFSVIPGKYYSTSAHKFDFRNSPVKNTYRFSDDVIEEDFNGPFKEYTISSIRFSGYQSWLNFKISGLLKRLGIKPYGNGSTVASTVIEEEDIYSGEGKRTVASFEGLTFVTLLKYLNAIGNSDYFHFISHPKLLTPHEFWLLNILLAKLRKYQVETDFRKVAEITG